jgi:hypothetical protein
MMIPTKRRKQQQYDATRECHPFSAIKNMLVVIIISILVQCSCSSRSTSCIGIRRVFHLQQTRHHPLLSTPSIEAITAFQQQQANSNRRIPTKLYYMATRNTRHAIKGCNIEGNFNSCIPSMTSFLLRMTNNNNRNDNQDNSNNQVPNRYSIIQRFIEPIIDDSALPISDALTAQIIAPGLQLGWLVLVNGPRPTWCTPFVLSATSNTLFTSNTAGTGSLIVPTLLHGAALAICWLVGALAAQAYKRSAISPTLKPRSNDKHSTVNDMDRKDETYYWDYRTVLWTLVQAGSFASGLLVLCTQIDVWTEYGGQYIEYLMSTKDITQYDELQFRTLVASAEVVNDIFFEALTIGTWRLYLAYQTSKDVMS